jgi:hypothetical protein
MLERNEMNWTRAFFTGSVGMILVACGGSGGGGGLGIFQMGGDAGADASSKKDGGSSSTGKSDSGTTSTGDDASGSSDSCTIPPGNYTLTATLASGSTSCPAIPSRSSTIEDGSLADVAGELMSNGSTCTSSEDTSTCTESIHCSVTDDGATEKVALTLTVDGDTATGKDTVTVSESGAVEITCTYDLVLEPTR